MDITYWHWLLLGIGLAAIELLFPGAFFLWIGIAALVTGALLFLAPSVSFSAALVIFAILSLIATYAGKHIYQALFTPTTDAETAALNKRGQQLVGQTLTLDAPILHGSKAHITVGDTKWLVKGPDLPEGTEVLVTGVEGNTLIVTRAPNGTKS